MKQIIRLFTMVGLSITLLVGCGSAAENNAGEGRNNTDSGEKKFKVAMVVGVGGLGDQSFNDGLYSGVLKAAELYGIEYQVIEPTEYTEFNDNFMSLSALNDYDIIIGCGYDATEGVSLAAKEYPDQQFIFIDGAVEGLNNVTNYTFRDNEKTFLVGMMAAMKTETGKIGLVMATDTPDQHVFVAGYLAGAKYINPNIDIQVKYIGSYSDITTAKELAIALVEENVDIIYAAAGGAGVGVYSSGDDYGFLSIGTDSNLCPVYPNSMFVSAYRDMELVVAEAVKAAMEGERIGESVSVGLAEGAVDITNEGSNVPIDDSLFAKTEEAKAAIIAGKITVPDTLK